MREKNKKWIVITSINYPTLAIKKIAELCGQQDWSCVVVGDKKTPKDWSHPNIHFMSVEEQKDLYGQLADDLPYNHYCRKNLGYLYAIHQGAECILETDDDNIPYESFGAEITRNLNGQLVKGRKWVNAYQHFTDKKIWPRGLPLDEINNKEALALESGFSGPCIVQQFLADGDPDVDAIYRLTCTDEVYFSTKQPHLILDEGSWCPFNSQNTLFFKESFPLLYLPCYVSFRMTDIWRSFVAQAALWKHQQRLAFLGPTVKQVRNAHDFVKDFEDEIPGYLQNRKICNALEELIIDKSGKADSMWDTVEMLWGGLQKLGIIDERDTRILSKWLLSAKG